MSIILNGKGMIFQQIVEYYKRYIKLGIIKENEKLPSCRALASELGINPNTVERAYKILEQEGYIKNISKKGVFVLSRHHSLDIEIINRLNEIKKTGVSKENLLLMIEQIYEKEESNND